MTSSIRDPYRDREDGMPEDHRSGTTKLKLEEDMLNIKSEVSTAVHEKAEAGQHRMAEEADALSEAIDAAASNLDEQDHKNLARYARELSSNLSDVAGHIESRSVDELATDAKTLARNNPALFMLGSIAIGFGLSRFFKASAEHDHRKDDSSRNNNAKSGTPVQHQDQKTETYTSATVPHNGDGRGIL